MHQLLERRYIYDPIQRVLHWWIGLSTIMLIFTGLYASNQEPGKSRAFIWDMHIFLGYALIVGLVGRVVLGVVGAKYALFRDLWPARAWLRMVRERFMPSADDQYGHHPAAAFTYVGFYGLTFLMVGSGLNLSGMLHGEGPLASLLDDLSDLDLFLMLHEYGMWAILVFIVGHIGALIWHEKQDKIPISQSMVSGYQYRTVKEAQDETES